MRHAIVGSRELDTRLVRSVVFAYVASLASDAVIVSGGARGPDTEGIRAARFYRRAFKIHWADWDRYGKPAGMIRNVTIVADCDRVLAVWDGASRGTMHTIKIAREQGRTVLVAMPTPFGVVFGE